MKEVILYSGGLDSTVLLMDRLRGRWDKSSEYHALHIAYGSTHSQMELHAASHICTMYEVPMRVIQLPLGAWGFESGLLTGDIPDGPYKEESLSSTVVPFRNGIMIAIAVGYALSIGASKVLIAAHAGDHPIYPDCTPEFLYAMSEAVYRGSGAQVALLYPYCAFQKWEIVAKGATLDLKRDTHQCHPHAPMHLSYSCYKGGVKHCGKCATCIERREAFATAKVTDLTEYET